MVVNGGKYRIHGAFDLVHYVLNTYRLGGVVEQIPIKSD